ncbi:hypothetical protein ABKN59_007242 [Abortiporus biennis]
MSFKEWDPNFSTNCFMSSRSPYLHESSSSSLSSSVGMGIDMMHVLISILFDDFKLGVYCEAPLGMFESLGMYSSLLCLLFTANTDEGCHEIFRFQEDVERCCLPITAEMRPQL